MKLFKRGSYEWWQVGILKLSLFAIGIAIGANLSAAFLPYTTVLVAGGIILGLYAAFVWLRQ